MSASGTRLYTLINAALDGHGDESRLVEIVDILERLRIRAENSGEAAVTVFDVRFADLLDSTMVESAPGARRILAILEGRGWRGWTNAERVRTD